MLLIPLAQVPNQQFSLQLDDDFYNITVKFIINLMTVTVVRNNETIIDNVRAEPDLPIIPYDYLEGDNGNFTFITSGGEYPIYSQFGITQFFFFADNEELRVLRETN